MFHQTVWVCVYVCMYVSTMVAPNVSVITITRHCIGKWNPYRREMLLLTQTRIFVLGFKCFLFGIWAYDTTADHKASHACNLNNFHEVKYTNLIQNYYAHDFVYSLTFERWINTEQRFFFFRFERRRKQKGFWQQQQQEKLNKNYKSNKAHQFIQICSCMRTMQKLTGSKYFMANAKTIAFLDKCSPKYVDIKSNNKKRRRK